MPTRASLPLRSGRLGRVEYVETARLQRSLRAAREDGVIDDLLLLLEHHPVITCGTRTEPHEVAYARTTDVPLVPVERGGKATYHGPGQVVAYPIIDISIVEGDVRELVRRLEQAIIDTLAAVGVASTRRDGFPGVWIADQSRSTRKIASVGLRLTRGVTFHGVAINVANDLDPFTWFTPCGIPDAEMTSVARELDVAVDEADRLVDVVEQRLEREIARQFGFSLGVVEPAELAAVAREHPIDDPDVSLPGEPRPRRAHRIDLTTVGTRA